MRLCSVHAAAPDTDQPCVQREPDASSAAERRLDAEGEVGAPMPPAMAITHAIGAIGLSCWPPPTAISAASAAAAPCPTLVPCCAAGPAHRVQPWPPARSSAATLIVS